MAEIEVDVHLSINVCGDCPYDKKGEGVIRMSGGVVLESGGWCKLGEFHIVNEETPPEKCPLRACAREAKRRRG